jgi:hypothetical protein
MQGRPMSKQVNPTRPMFKKVNPTRPTFKQVNPAWLFLSLTETSFVFQFDWCRHYPPYIIFQGHRSASSGMATAQPHRPLSPLSPVSHEHHHWPMDNPGSLVVGCEHCSWPMHLTIRISAPFSSSLCCLAMKLV